MSKILVVEDDQVQRTLLCKLLENGLGFPTIQAANGAEAIYWVKEDTEEEISAVLLDLEMPEMGGKECLPRLLAERPKLPVIVLTASNNAEEAIELIQIGAADFMTKPANKERLRVSLTNLLKLHELQEELGRISRRSEGKTLFSDLIGYDKGLKNTVKLAMRAAQSDVTVMLAGEGGVGKEMLLHAIHGESERAGNPFVMVNCGTLTDVDSAKRALFGARVRTKKGDYRINAGAFTKAAEGTICLDEVGELPMEAQTALFYTLERKNFLPEGSEDRQPVKARIIATSSRDLYEMVQAGLFREDLYYRLHVFPILMPSLRHRREDIEPLAMFFLKRHAATEQKTITSFDGPARRWLNTHDWPGNVRELENAVYRAVLLCDGDKIGMEQITPFHFQQHNVATSPGQPYVPPVSSSDYIPLLDESGAIRSMEAIKMDAMDKAWAHCEKNTVKAAEALGIGKSTFYRKRAEAGDS